jgi:hypothetical protein
MVHSKAVTSVAAIFIFTLKNTRVKKLFLKAQSRIYVLVFWVMAFRNFLSDCQRLDKLDKYATPMAVDF